MPMDYFNHDQGVLSVTLPLPPSDNKLTRSGMGHRYATAEYRDWLDVAGDRVRVVLGDWTPDAPTRDAKGKITVPGRWWMVSGSLALGTRDKDAANHIKATLDLLSGAWVPKKDETGYKDGVEVEFTAGVVYRPGLLWDDDHRATIGYWNVAYTHHPEPYLSLLVRPLAGPTDYREYQKALKRFDREQAKWKR